MLDGNRLLEQAPGFEVRRRGDQGGADVGELQGDVTADGATLEELDVAVLL